MSQPPPIRTRRPLRSKQPSHYVSSLLGSLTAFAILGGVAFAGMIYLIVVFSMAAAGSGGDKHVKVPKDSVLVVDLWMNITDSPPIRGMDSLLDEAVWGPSTPRLYLLEVVDGIKRAATDSRIKALFIHGSLLPENYGSGLAALREVRGAIETFKASGKPVIAYTTDPTLRDYYLMSAADTVIMNPFGVLGLNGLATEGMFFGQAFEKYGIGVQTTRVGKYKSAVEMFTRESMSEADREQITALLDSIWDSLLSEIAESRGVDLKELIAQSDREGFFTSAEAVQLGLAERVAYFDEVIDELQTVGSYDDFLDSFRQVALADYIKAHGFRQAQGFFSSSNAIAVVYAEGDIVDGEGFPNQVGGERLARELRMLRDDPEVAAVVLRVNSPGGSALAAEVIQREIVMTQKSKPVIVSMGSLAASGGYWISASAERIYAEPTTITGSIGVFGLLFNFKQLANDHGITFDGVKTSTFADLYTISREKTPEEMALIQEFTDFIYDQFLQKVAKGRSLPIEGVAEIAQGRVWTGQQAMKIGLVDEIGGLEDAIEFAASSAGAGDNWTIRQIPEKKNFSEALQELLARPNGTPPVIQQRPSLMGQITRSLQSELSSLKAYNDPKGIYARLPFKLDF